MKRTFKLCAVAAALAGSVGAASASVAFTFNPTGGGFGAGAVTATTMDQAPGNALAVNGSGAVGACLTAAGWAPGVVGVFNCAASGITTQFTYQANLGQFTNLGAPVFNQNGGGRNFTFTASLTERVTSVAVISVDGVTGLPTFASANFVINPVQTANFFRMYFTGAAGGNDLTGAGFTSATLILQGQAFGSTSSSTSDSACARTNPTSCPNLDNFAGDNWNSFDTVTNNGSTQLQIAVTAANAGYFPDLPIGSFIQLDVNTSQVLPFNQANPACAMIDPVTGAAQGYALGTYNAGTNTCGGPHPTLDPINGQNLAGDFLFQADANSSLQFTTPEPGSLALFAGSLMAAGLWGRRRSAKK